jgi:N-acetylglucosaminyldiphosphoundecaprenol N-acetyl-beta-D-mannosaminyltransferase
VTDRWHSVSRPSSAPQNFGPRVGVGPIRLREDAGTTLGNAALPVDRPVTREILGLRFSNLTPEQIVEQATRATRSSFELVVTCNLDHLFNLRRSATFRAAYAQAAIITIDGAPIEAYLRLNGIRDIQRATGADLLPEIMDRLIPGIHRPFFVCATIEIGKSLLGRLRMRGFEEDAVKFNCPPFGFENDIVYSDAMAHDMMTHRATHIVFGLGSPKSEIWLHQHMPDLPAAYAFCFGAGLDFAAGMKRRAPHWMRRIGLEWLWRLSCEPKRLIGRYVRDAVNFLAVIAEDVRKGR